MPGSSSNLIRRRGQTSTFNLCSWACGCRRPCSGDDSYCNGQPVNGRAI
jgi:hypothetical protein